MDLPDPAPPLDAQSRAYREMGPDDAVADSELLAHASAVHTPLDPDQAVAEQILLPADYEAAGWDAARTDPRPPPAGGEG